MAFSLSHKGAKLLLMACVLPFALISASSHAQEESQWGGGKNLYQKVCAHCHAAEVGVGPEIGGRGLVEPYINIIVRQGLGPMPAFPASFIDDESIAFLTKYLASLPPPATLQQGD